MPARPASGRPAKTQTGAEAPFLRWPRVAAILLAAILLCGLGLRMAGLSHGLIEEKEPYHPDTPHLISASRHFLHGTYFFRINHRDYDGYPYFYSHVVEYLWRGVWAVRSFFSRLLLGAESSGEALRIERLSEFLFWLGRLTNVAFSTLLILVVYRIGARNLDRTTGLIAASLLAISPMNVATAHFATNDTLVTFFTTLAVLFALRMYSEGGWVDYLLGGALVALAFSAKYHGSIVVLTCLLAHILRYWPPRKMLAREALSRLALMAIAFFIVFLLANPSFLVSPGKAFHDFREYCQYIPTAKLTPAQRELGFFARAGLSFTLNLPILLRCMGPVLSVIALLGLVHAFCRGKRIVVLASFPAVYLLFTFLSKPIQQRFYLGVVLPTSYLLAATFVVTLARTKKIKAPATAGAVVVLVLAGFYLLKSSLKETFFFSHRDTRRCAREWASENIPLSYRIKAGRYTFSLERPREAKSGRAGTILLSSSLAPAELPQESFLLKAFDLEEDALPLFRNPRIEVHAQPSSLLSEGFVLPVYQRIPSQKESEFIFADGATFFRDPKMLAVAEDRPLSRILVSKRPLEDAIVVVENGYLQGSVRVRLGGVRKTFFLEPCGVRWKEVRNLRESFPSSPSRHFYKLTVSGTVPAATVHVALTAEEKGVALYNAGEYASAYPFLARASRSNRSPVLSAMAYVSGKLSTGFSSSDEEKALLEDASFFNKEISPETIAAAFRISPEYLNSLPYLSFKPYKNSSQGFHSVADISASADSAAVPDLEPLQPDTWFTGTPGLILEPGCYRATLRVRCEPDADPDAALEVCLVERQMKAVISRKEFRVGSLRDTFTNLQFPFEKPAEVAECRVLVRSTRYLPLFIDRIEIRPDPLESLLCLQRLVRNLSCGPDTNAPVGLLDYGPLLRLGRHAMARGEHRQALTSFLLAHQLRPDLAGPVSGIEQIRAMNLPLSPEESTTIEEILADAGSEVDAVEVAAARVTFGNGMKLTGYTMTRGPFHPGERIALSLTWSVARTRRIPEGLVVWMHVVDPSGRKALQLDHYLSEDLCFPQKPRRIVPVLPHEAEIPADTLPGTYRLEMGLWIPLRDSRPPITETALPHTRYSVTLGEIVIERR